MKIKKENILDFSDLFEEAKKRLGWSWNECCDIFHREEIICSPENRSFRDMYLDDTEYYETKAKEGDKIAMGYKLIHDIMRENNLDKLKIITG